MSAAPVCRSPRVLVHIGYHKTGTTWFQGALFARPELGFVPWTAPRGAVHALFCRPGPFEEGPPELARDLVAQAEAATGAGKVFVVSHERLSGYPASGGYDARSIADRLKTYLPNARVLCLFRRQDRMIHSVWRQQIVDGGDRSLAAFLAPPEPGIARVPMFDPGMYRYTGACRYYRTLFGAAQTRFVPYERFTQDPRAVLADLAALVELPALAAEADRIVAAMTRPNPSLSPTVLRLFRLVNHWGVRTQLSPRAALDLGAAQVRGVMRRLSALLGPTLLAPLDRWLDRREAATIARFCAGRYDADNAELSALLGLPLAPLGYAVADQPNKGPRG